MKTQEMDSMFSLGVKNWSWRNPKAEWWRRVGGSRSDVQADVDEGPREGRTHSAKEQPARKSTCQSQFSHLRQRDLGRTRNLGFLFIMEGQLYLDGRFTTRPPQPLLLTGTFSPWRTGMRGSSSCCYCARVLGASGARSVCAESCWTSLQCCLVTWSRTSAKAKPPVRGGAGHIWHPEGQDLQPELHGAQIPHKGHSGGRTSQGTQAEHPALPPLLPHRGQHPQLFARKGGNLCRKGGVQWGVHTSYTASLHRHRRPTVWCHRVCVCVCVCVDVCSVAQSCLTLCDPLDWSPSDSSVHGISLARKPECVAMPSSRGSSWSKHRTRVSCISYTGRRIL